MLKFSKKVEYALIAMIEMAGNSGNSDLITAKSVANRYRIPQEIMGKVLQTLVKKGLLHSVQGVRGGYTLADSPDNINVLKVVEAVDGPLKIISCTEGRICDCEQLIHCSIKTPMQLIQEELSRFFMNISVRDLMERLATPWDLLDNKQTIN